jgi:hypothetical protein
LTSLPNTQAFLCYYCSITQPALTLNLPDAAAAGGIAVRGQSANMSPHTYIFHVTSLVFVLEQNKK